jgi:hypothetical protein
LVNTEKVSGKPETFKPKLSKIQLYEAYGFPELYIDGNFSLG